MEEIEQMDRFIYPLELTEEECRALKLLHEDYESQKHNNWAPYPNLYYLIDYEQVPTSPDYSDGVEYFHRDDWELIGNVDDLYEFISDNYEEEFLQFKKYYFERFDEEFDWDKDFEELLHYEDFSFVEKVYYKDVEQIKGVFLTEKSAKNYLDSNKHHYSDRAYICHEKPWRNPMMETLISLLLKIEGEFENEN